MLDDIGHRDAAAHGPAADMDLLAVPTERFDQGLDVLGPVVEAARRVDRLGLGAAEAAEVGSRDAEVVGQLGGDVLPEATGDQVAVDEQDRRAVLRPAGPDAHANAIGVERLREIELGTLEFLVESEQHLRR